jgi:hypothetical protein
MATDTIPSKDITLSLNEAERRALLELLQMTLGEVRVELHRTHTPDYRDFVQRQESIIRGLLEKIGAPRA